MSDHRYYIVFVDDFSRASWIYLLKDRSHVIDILKIFINEIKNQFVVTSKCLHTDNALEFVQSSVQSYCASLGIIHQTTCFHMSQQNGVTERKHRHILDVTRTIMLQMHVPKYLWSDVVFTTSYLINRIPSTPLGGEVPFRRFQPDAELFPLSPRFWVYCLCPGSHKLPLLGRSSVCLWVTLGLRGVIGVFILPLDGILSQPMSFF